MSISAQTNIDRSNYALLWEISGKGLEKPSYLFGSMHIRQDFAFEFPDSLIIVLKNSEAFANEVHLDSATFRMLNVFKGNARLNIDSNYIEFIKTKKVQLDTSFLQKKQKITDFFKKNNPDSLVLESVELMPTMLDAYLMNIARGLGKELHGLENIDNHLYESKGEVSTEFSFSLFGDSYSDLQKSYYAGDLTAIQEIIQKEAKSFDNLDLIPRNYIIIENMLRIMQKQNLFSTVGAAHLPGKEGIIQLLQDKGYTLRPIQPSFKHKSILSSINIEQLTKKRPWSQVVIERPQFKLATPLPFVLKKIDPFESNFLQVDIGRGLFYAVTTKSLTPNSYTNFDEYLFEDEGFEITSKLPINYGGVDGYEYELSKIFEEVSAYKSYVFIKNGELYHLQIGAYDEATFDQTIDPLLFLKKFSINPSHPDKWHIIKEAKGGFTANLPRHYTYRHSFGENHWTNSGIHTYTAGFGDKLSSVSLQYTDLPTDIQECNDSLQLVLELETIEERLGISLQVENRTKNNWGTYWTFKGKFPSEALFVDGHLQTRANRIYSWFSIDKNGFQQTKKFLQGFHLTPWDTGNHLEVTSIGDSLFQCYLPKDVEQSEHKFYQVNSRNTFIEKTYFAASADSYAGARYKVEIQQFHSLFGTTDTLGFLHEKVIELIGSNGITTSEMSLYQNQYPQLRIYARDSCNRYETLHQLYLKDKYLILKTVFADSNYFETTTCMAFFEQDDWSENNLDDISSLSSKGDSIIQLLELQDTSYWVLLNKVIDTKFSFEEKDFDPLLALILKTNWSSSSVSRTLQDKLLTSLFLLDKEHIAIAMKALFRELHSSDLFLKEAILTALLEEASSNKQSYFDAFFDLLIEDDLFYKNSSKQIFDYFYSNISELEQNIDNLKHCLEKKKDHIALWELAVLLSQNNRKGNDAVNSILNSFLKRGHQRLDAYYLDKKKDKETIKNTPIFVLDFYQLFLKNKAVKQQIKFFLDKKRIDIFTVALVDIALKTNIEVSNKKKRKLLDNPKTWLSMIKILNNHHLLDDINSKYYQKKRIAKSLLMFELKQTKHTASAFLLEGEFEITSKGEEQVFYLFTFSTKGRPFRLGAVGIFSKNENERHFIGTNNIVYTDYPVVKRRRLEKAKELVAEMLNY